MNGTQVFSLSAGALAVSRTLICAVAIGLVATPAGVSALIVNQVNGADDRWSSTQALNLTYCVSNRFAGAKARVVAAMAEGAVMWERVARIDFIYLPQHDSNCNVRNNRVLFSVEPTRDPTLYARSFFPHYPRRYRSFLINAPQLFNADFPPENMLAHELGHALGFRHEHIRPEADVSNCVEDNNWRPLTQYDASSIMHFPWCSAHPTGFTFSALDAEGAAALYGSW